MEGFLEKKASGLLRSWQKRYFRQEGLSLKYFTKEGDLEAKQDIELKDVIRVRSGPYKGKPDKNSSRSVQRVSVIPRLSICVRFLLSVKNAAFQSSHVVLP